LIIGEFAGVRKLGTLVAPLGQRFCYERPSFCERNVGFNASTSAARLTTAETEKNHFVSICHPEWRTLVCPSLKLSVLVIFFPSRALITVVPKTETESAIIAKITARRPRDRIASQASMSVATHTAKAMHPAIKMGGGRPNILSHVSRNYSGLN
jgi:hypothetical protein